MMSEKQPEGSAGYLVGFLGILGVLGILGAIALPSFLNQPCKAKQSEAKTYVGSMNRAQQAYYLENNAFGSTVENLGLGIPTQTTNYSYSVRETGNSAYNYGIARKEPLKSYVGGVFRKPVSNTTANSSNSTELTTFSILCESESRGRIKPRDPILIDSANLKAVCAPGTRLLETR